MTSISYPSILTLPSELRISILEYALYGNPRGNGFTSHTEHSGLILDDTYSPADNMSLLLTCRQFRNDFSSMVFKRTPFVVTDIYATIPMRLGILKQWQVEAIRELTFVAGSRQLREMVHWTRFPFNVPSLCLNNLTVVLHRSGHWLYPSDFTTDMVAFLRRLQNVKMLRFVRNGANVKGFFKTWYNRLIGLVLKEDHLQRYDAKDAPNVEKTWWEWRYDDEGMFFELDAKPPKPVMDESDYMVYVRPLIDELMISMENEEEDPDPRARNGWA